MCQQQERSSVSAYFLIDREVQNKPQASSLHLIQIKRGRPLLGERCWEARHRITGLNDKRKFYKIVPLSYCGLVMPLFFFSVCYFEVSGLVFMRSKEKAMRSISDCKNDRTQCCHKNHEDEFSLVQH